MPCFRPLEAWPLSGGGITFLKTKSYRGAQPLSIPCGQCAGCKLERARQWAVRLTHEAQLHDHKYFVTLTLNDEHLPTDYSVDVRHIQLFFKRLRKEFGRVRYFACGEYGETTLRPHYHAIIFGPAFRDLVPIRQSSRGDILYFSNRLSAVWGLGHVSLGAVTFQSAGYVARYALKKITGEQAKDHYTRVHPHTGEICHVRPEFITMSRRPGIGSGWYDKFSSDLWPSDECVVNGHKQKVPRYYDLKRDQPSKAGDLRSSLDHIKLDRKEAAWKHADNNTPERLAVREEVTLTKTSTLKRGLE